MRIGIISIILIAFLPFFSAAQLPSTDLFSLDMKINEVRLILENPNYLSSFNPEGYNNQPAFIDKDRLLITSDWQAKGLTDIYLMDFEKNELTRITATDESEYSPTPSDDGSHFFVVRQEATESDTIPQILWRYPLDRSDSGKPAIDEITNIGYFRFVSDEMVALFQVGSPNSLSLYHLGTKKQYHISGNIGRAIKFDRDRGLYFVNKYDNTSYIRLYDVRSRTSRRIAPTPGGQEDFDILPNGNLILGQGSVLYQYDIAKGDGWKEIIDLSETGIEDISRIAVTADKVVFVASH